MPTITNDIDLILQAAATRFPPPDDHALLLGCTSPGGFKVSSGGIPTPSEIVFTPILIGMTGTVSYSLTGGLALTYAGNVGTLSFANMTANSGTVTVNLTVDGVAHSRSITISKVFDGSSGTGTPGQRGAGSYYVAGSGWSDLAADLSTPGDTVLDDQVTIWNGTNYAEVKRWNGSVWVPAGLHMPGDVIVPGTLTGNRIKAGTLELYKPDGTPIITLGGLQTGFEAPGTKNSEQTLAALGQNTFRVVALGSDSASHPAAPGLYRNGVIISGVGRSYILQVIRRSDGSLLSSQTYDVIGNGAVSSGRNAATLAADLNALGPDKIAVVYSYDEPATNRDAGGLPAAMYRCGASRTIFGSPAFQYRSAYILVGIPGCGEGNGAEAYRGDVGSDPNAWCDVGFSLANGIVTGITGASSVGNLVNTGLINAQTTADNAEFAAGTALNALPGMNAEIAAKLSKTGNEEIYGQKSLMSQYALLVGTVNDGIIYGSTGMYGRKAGLTTFSIGADGTAIFAGTLLAPSGSFGVVSIAAGGKLTLGAATTFGGEGVFLGYVGATAKFSIVSGSSKLLYDPSSGTPLQIVNPVLELTKPAIAAMSAINSPAGGAGIRTLPPRTAVPTAGRAGFTFLWRFEPDFDAINQIQIYSGFNTDTVTLRTSPQPAGTSIGGWAYVDMKDANGLSTTGNFRVDAYY